MNERHLRWEACLNARDVGGYKTADGRETRWRALVRSDRLSLLTEAGRQCLVDYGVSRVVDLRFEDEAARDPHAFFGTPLYVNVPMTSGRENHDFEEIGKLFLAARTRLETYLLELRINRPGFRCITSSIANAPDGAVLVHCHAGKDRTGLTVALLLSLVGVPDDVIAEEYALTTANLSHLYAAWLEKGAFVGEALEREKQMLSSDAKTMFATLQHLGAEYGGAEAYLREAGLTTAEIEALKARLLA